MCGFAGVVAPPSPEQGRAWAAWAASRMVRRGPDDEGRWDDDEAGIHLAFRRLAIIDLSEHGHQPMVGHDGRSALVFNGELYGYRDLRRRLEADGVAFRGGSDTEVVLAALDRWGEAALERFDGMFALAWWHGPDRRLVLARDHAGIKPLFTATGPGGRGVCFASQYDVVANGPWGVPPVDPTALATYLELHHVPAPLGLLQRTGQLEPGEAVVVRDGRIQARRRWWTLPPAVDGGVRGAAAVDRVAEVLTATVDQQLVADRPVGTFLSGGVDSALVTAVAEARVDHHPLQAFTVSFPGAASDEAAKAREFAAATGVEHHVLPLDDDGALAAVDDAIAAMAEPVGDFSIVPTTLLAGFAASRVTVALSGDGGDELFYGYVRPWSLLRSGGWFRAPWAVRRARYLAGRLPGLAPVSEAISAHSPGAYYRGVNSRSGSLVGRLGPDLPAPAPLWWFDTPSRADHHALVRLARLAEYHGQLQRVLRKVDLASMHHSLEVRVPVLGRAVVELSAEVDADWCLRDGARKAPLRDLLARLVPGVVQQTEKQGFTPPMGAWLDGPLRERVAHQVAARSWHLDALLDPTELRRLADPATPARHWNLWTVLALEWWLDRLARLPGDFS